MNKDNEKITYEEFITMFKIAPRMCYTLYVKAEDEIEKLQQENQRLKKQKDDVVEYIKKNKLFKYVYDEEELFEIIIDKQAKDDLLRMLGEIDD